MEIPVCTDIEDDPDKNIRVSEQVTRLYLFFQVSLVGNPSVCRVLPENLKEVESSSLKDKVLDRLATILDEECKHLCSVES